jgi:DNA-binding NarL/FixJ family response regulator
MKSDSPIPKSSRRRVFIVDDHPLVREWLGGLVGGESDLQVCGQAEDGPTALAAIPIATPDVVVVDLTLPRSSGIELIKDLRAQYPDLKILVLSMHDEVSIAERAFRAGANGYVVKRDSSERIIEGIRTVLSGRVYASSTLTAQLAEKMFAGSARDGAPPEEVLSERELEVFQLRGQGRTPNEIALHLKVSIKTVGSYDARIKTKLGLQNAAELLRAAVRWNDSRTGSSSL